MASSSEEWYFTKTQLENSPSRECGYEPSAELSQRQESANFIQAMGEKLKVTQLVINTAIVYMHRFYALHSFTHFLWFNLSVAAIFLAAKVENQPQKIQLVIWFANICRNARDTKLDTKSEDYRKLLDEIFSDEEELLISFNFNVTVEHPHMHVILWYNKVGASKDLAEKSYKMATYSINLTTLCIQYKPTVVACFCIFVGSKWSNCEIPLLNGGKRWYQDIDTTVTPQLLEHLTEEFLVVVDNYPHKLNDEMVTIVKELRSINFTSRLEKRKEMSARKI